MANLRFENENIASQGNIDTGEQLFIPTEKQFLYHENPYESHILAQKEAQVLQELKFLEQNVEDFEKLCAETT